VRSKLTERLAQRVSTRTRFGIVAADERVEPGAEGIGALRPLIECPRPHTDGKSGNAGHGSPSLVQNRNILERIAGINTEELLAQHVVVVGKLFRVAQKSNDAGIQLARFVRQRNDGALIVEVLYTGCFEQPCQGSIAD